MRLLRPIIAGIRNWQRQRDLAKLPGGPDWTPNLSDLERRELSYSVNHPDLYPFYQLINGRIEELHQAIDRYEPHAERLWKVYVPTHKLPYREYDKLYLGKAYIPVFKEFRANHSREFNAFMRYHRKIVRYWSEIQYWRRNRAALDREAEKIMRW